MIFNKTFEKILIKISKILKRFKKYNELFSKISKILAKNIYVLE